MNAMICSLLLVGDTIVYQPTAIVHHYHRRDYDPQVRQMQRYGRELTAFYSSMLINHPGSTARFLKVGGYAVPDHLARGGRPIEEIDTDFPRESVRANRLVLIQGRFAYTRARVHARPVSMQSSRKRTTVPSDRPTTRGLTWAKKP
jgi:hypothetical protein